MVLPLVPWRYGASNMLADLADRLQAYGAGTVGESVFYGFAPDTPDNCVSLMQYAGMPADLTHDGNIVRMPGVQVRVRNAVQVDGIAICDLVEDALTFANTQVGSTYILLSTPNQAPESLGRDANGRWLWVQNFRVMRR